MIDQKLLRVQNALYEKAHSHPCELKFLAIKMAKQGIEEDKWYSNPQMIPLPLIGGGCPRLGKLTARQKAIISAYHFAYIYKVVARSEVLALTANIAVADRVFTPYSDEWMVLYQETQEEMDHIWSFRHFFNATLAQSDKKEPLAETGFFEEQDATDDEGNEVDFRTPKTGSIPWWAAWNDESWEGKTLYYYLHNIRSIPEKDIQGTTLGALYLFTRYVSNVHLKQVEAFLFHAPEKWNYEPLAQELTEGHHNDEARHYTTSFDLGLELFKASDRTGQEMVRYYAKHLVEGHIRSFFLTFYEMIENGERGEFANPYVLGLNSLDRALLHPEFSDEQIDIRALRREWYENKVGQGVFPLKKLRWRYVATSIERMVQALDLKLNPENMGEQYNRYQEALL